MNDVNPKQQRLDREWARRRRDIMTTAAELFAELGFAQTSVQAIADRAGFSVGYLYKQFDGKVEVLNSLMEFHLEQFEKLAHKVENLPGMTPLERLRLDLVNLCDYLDGKRFLVPLFFQTQPDLNPDLRRLLLRFRQRTTQRLEGAHRLGELPACDPRLLAAVIDGMTGNLLQALADDPDPESYQRIPDLVEEYVLKPLTAKVDQTQRKDTKDQ